jgi:dipeptidyl aminopeptidase/acylaminoacyl peptidase
MSSLTCPKRAPQSTKTVTESDDSSRRAKQSARSLTSVSLREETSHSVATRYIKARGNMHIHNMQAARPSLPCIVAVLAAAILLLATIGQVAAAGPAHTGVIVFQTVSGGAIYAINADGTHLRHLTDGMDPALSPDGRQVAFTRWDNPQIGALGSVWVINVDGTGEHIVLEDVHQPKAPTWSPDGTRIIISMQQGGSTEIRHECVPDSQRSKIPRDAYDVSVKRDSEGDVTICYNVPPYPYYGLRLVDVGDGQFQDLPRDRYSLTPTWDPVHPWRAVYRGNDGLMALDLVQHKTWAVTNDTNDHSPVFSPDGTRLAVAYWQNDHWEIHVLNADGSGRVRLTETSLIAIADQRLKGQEPRSFNNTAPVWSPDGQSIAFLTDRSGKWELWVMGADGSNPHPLLPPDALQGINLEYHGMEERVFTWR